MPPLSPPLPRDPEPRPIHVLTNGRIVIESPASKTDRFPHLSFSPSPSPHTRADADAPPLLPGSDPSSPSTASTLVFDGTSPNPYIDTSPSDDYGPIRTARNPASIARRLSHVGLLGILDLGFASHLVFATRATCVAHVAGAPIYKVAAVDALPIVSPPTRSMAQEAYESTALRNLLYYLNHHPVYYSRHMDLSRSVRVQALGTNTPQPNWDFVLNAALLPRSLMYPAASPTSPSPSSSSSPSPSTAATDFFIPVIAGHVSHTTPLPTLSLTLIARTHTQRLGRRYFSRGMAPTGGAGCSNAIESELILTHNGTHLASHVQWRGSVPLVWSQAPTYDLTVWKPPVVVSALHARGDWNPVARYLSAWTRLVPRVVFLDLLDRASRGERVLSETFEQAVGELRDASEPVANTSGGRVGERDEVSGRCWPVEYVNVPVADRTHEAVRSVADAVSGSPGVHQVTSVDFGAASRVRAGKMQSTVIRTNCLDSIDRTNLVQLQIANLALAPLLDAIGFAPPGDPATIPSALRCMWTAHGHDLARHYVGTLAVSQELACQPVLAASAAARRPWVGIGIENEATLARRQYLQYFVDPCLQDVFDEHLCPPAFSPGPSRPGATSAVAPAAAAAGPMPPPPHVRQRLFALQRKVSGDECELPLVGFAFVFARKHVAPMNVDGVLGLVASVLWMASAVLVQWWLGGGKAEAARGIVRRPRRVVGSGAGVGNVVVGSKEWENERHRRA